MSNTSDKGAVWKTVVTAVVVALLAGTTAPWWWKQFFDGDRLPPPPPQQTPPESAQKRTVTIPEHNFWMVLPRPVSDLRGRIHVWNSGEKIEAQVRVVHESGPERDRLLKDSEREPIYIAPSGFRICPLKLPAQDGQHILGLQQYCKQGNHCSYNFPDEPDRTRVNVRFDSLRLTIVRGEEVCD
jgi:hypothetical protein